MIKRTLYFGNPAYLKTGINQLIVELPEGVSHSMAIEDLGLVVLDHPQITITQGLLAKLMQYNVAVVNCDATHHPAGMLFNLEGNTLQSHIYQAQAEASVPLKKNLWQQTVQAKIRNQAGLLQRLNKESGYLTALADRVKSGDSENAEATAAAWYWKRLFAPQLAFVRERKGMPPNHLLNYAYAILRAMVARALVGSGLLPTLGIFHRNQYNAFCLADDIMEPYRPFADELVCQITLQHGFEIELTKSIKQEMLGLPAWGVKMEGRRSPLMNALSRTTHSLAKCFTGEARKILYPEFAA